MATILKIYCELLNGKAIWLGNIEVTFLNNSYRIKKWPHLRNHLSVTQVSDKGPSWSSCCTSYYSPDKFSRCHIDIFSYFSQKIGFDILCKLSPRETFAWNVKAFFLGKIRKEKKIKVSAAIIFMQHAKNIKHAVDGITWQKITIYYFFFINRAGQFIHIISVSVKYQVLFFIKKYFCLLTFKFSKLKVNIKNSYVTYFDSLKCSQEESYSEW